MSVNQNGNMETTPREAILILVSWKTKCKRLFKISTERLYF